MKVAVSETCQKVSYSFKQKRIFLKYIQLYETMNHFSISRKDLSDVSI